MKKFYVRLLVLAALFIAIPASVFAYSWLYVMNPRTWGNSGQGSIDEAVITAEPKGVYMEYSLYLTFSAKGLEFTSNDSLEISCYFSLPKNSIVHDCQLWVGDSAVVAKLMDRWTAWSIYEDIVKRRRDPLVMYQDWQNNYQLRIYPLMQDGQRKLKISFLTPATWSSRSVSAALPLDILQASLIPTSSIKLYVKGENGWANPQIPGYSDIRFTHSTDSGFQDFLQASITPQQAQNQLQLSFASPMKEGVYMDRYDQNASEGIYQMAFLPSEVFNITDNKKVLCLFDFEVENNYQTNGNEVYYALQSMLHNSFGNDDAFNIFFSDAGIRKASENWIQADTNSLKETFAQLGHNPVADYTNIKKLLKEAIKFIKDKGGDGEILLLANSDNYLENADANALMEELKDMGSLPKITIIDFYELWYSWRYYGGQYFRGNQYLYTLLTRQSGGNLYEYNYWENSVSEILDKAFSYMSGFLTSFDLHTRLNDGFCFGRYNVGESNQNVNLNKPIIQIGKYHGSGDIVIEAAAVYQGDAIYANRRFNNILMGDSLMEEMWAGNYIASLEEDWTWDNQRAQEIIKSSLEYRVLSNYTAFLALEPGMEYIPPDDQNSNSSPVGGETVLYSTDLGDKASATGIASNRFDRNDFPYKVFPNPFYHQLHVQVALPEAIDWRTVIVEVYNLTGQKVHAFSTGEMIYNGFLNIEWNGCDSGGNELSQGIYYLVLRNDQFKKEIKIVKLK